MSGDLAPYLREARDWDHDRLRFAERSRRLAWIIAGAASLICLAAVGAVAALAPLKRVEPFLVRVDRSSGAVDVITRLSADFTPDEAVSKYFLARYVRAREGWLAAAARENFQDVALFSGPAEQRRYADLMAASNPQSPQVRLGPDATAEISIRAVSFINAEVAAVRFHKVVRKAQAVLEEDAVATLRFTYANAPMREADRLKNPLGFQVLDYRADPETGA